MAAAAVCLLAVACSDETVEPPLLPFAESIERSASGPLLSMETDGVRLDVYSHGNCATIIEYVPDYGYLVDDFCPPPPVATAFGQSFGTPNCPFTDFGDECRDWLPQFVVGRTVVDAAFVCLAGGRVEVRDGWWLAAAEYVDAEAFPMNAGGVRLDSVGNELDDSMRDKCAISDPALDEALIEIRTTGYQLPITVELDNGVSGSFLLYEGFEPFVFGADLPVGDGPMFVVVFEGADGTGIGEVSVPAAPECEDPVFVLDLSGPNGEWTCG
jgi:hypothetical protein